MRRADRVTGAALLAFSAAFGIGALKNHSYWGDNGPGPGFLPVWLALAMGLLSSLLLWRAWRRADPGPRWLPVGAGLRRLALVVGATVALVVLLSVLGMLVATLLFMVAVVRGLDRHPWPRTLAVAAGIAAFNAIVFTWWLKVPLPVGIWGF